MQAVHFVPAPVGRTFLSKIQKIKLLYFLQLESDLFETSGLCLIQGIQQAGF